MALRTPPSNPGSRAREARAELRSYADRMTSGPSGGFLHLLPTFIPRGMQATAMTVSMSPWLAPAFSGVAKTTTDTASAALAVTFEWPMNWLRTASPLPKFDREWLFARRYSCDQALATGQHAFADVQPG